MTAEQIAARLTKAQMDALDWLPVAGLMSQTRCPWDRLGGMRALERGGLASKHIIGLNGIGNDCCWSLTPLGLEVRRILQETTDA